MSIYKRKNKEAQEEEGQGNFCRSLPGVAERPSMRKWGRVRPATVRMSASSWRHREGKDRDNTSRERERERRGKWGGRGGKEKDTPPEGEAVEEEDPEAPGASPFCLCAAFSSRLTS